MGRPPKHDWPAMLEEYREGQWDTVAAYAAEKTINVQQMTREFRRLGFVARKQNAQLRKRQNKTGRSGGKNGKAKGGKHAAQSDAERPTPRHPICGARAKSQGGKPCGRPAGWGTDHNGTGRCKLHGGSSHGAPVGNKNGLRHGAYATVIREQLSLEDRAIFDAITGDEGLQEELRIVKYKLVTLLRPMQKQVAVGGPDGAEVVTLEIDEVTRARGIAVLVDSARKILKDLRESGQDDDGSLSELMAMIEESRRATSNGV